MLAGALTRNNAALVGANIGRQPSNGELYIAHFLGADGAGKLISGCVEEAAQPALPPCFRNAAARQPQRSSTTTGRARSVGEVYGKLTGFSIRPATLPLRSGSADERCAPLPRSAGTAIAAAGDRRIAPVKSVPRARRMRVGLPVPPASIQHPAAQSRRTGPDTAGMTQAFAQAGEKLPPPPGAAVVPVDVHGSRQPASGADRQQALGPAPAAAPPAPPSRCSISSPTPGPTSASFSATRPDAPISAAAGMLNADQFLW